MDCPIHVIHEIKCPTNINDFTVYCYMNTCKLNPPTACLVQWRSWRRAACCSSSATTRPAPTWRNTSASSACVAAVRLSGEPPLPHMCCNWCIDHPDWKWNTFSLTKGRKIWNVMTHNIIWAKLRLNLLFFLGYLHMQLLTNVLSCICQSIGRHLSVDMVVTNHSLLCVMLDPIAQLISMVICQSCWESNNYLCEWITIKLFLIENESILLSSRLVRVGKSIPRASCSKAVNSSLPMLHYALGMDFPIHTSNTWKIPIFSTEYMYCAGSNISISEWHQSSNPMVISLVSQLLILCNNFVMVSIIPFTSD